MRFIAAFVGRELTRRRGRASGGLAAARREALLAEAYAARRKLDVGESFELDGLGFEDPWGNRLGLAAPGA